jgi:hypothetical protein
MPDTCTKDQIRGFSNDLLKYIEMEDRIGVGKVVFPKQDNQDISPLFPPTLGIMLTVVSLALLGVIVEKTRLLDKSQGPAEANQDAMSRKNRLGQALLCFSVTRNLKKLSAKTGEQDASLKVFHGIKVIAMCSVVLVHYYKYVLQFPIENYFQIGVEFMDRYWMTAVF